MHLIKFSTFLFSLVVISSNLFSQNKFQKYITTLPSGFTFSSTKVVFASNIPYDTLDTNQQLFDIFLPAQTGSFPLVINIHGGGFTGGSKDSKYTSTSGREEIQNFVNQGVAYASIEYRLINANGPDTSGVKKPLYDVKRALQFIRYYYKDLKIKPENIVLTGSSAGAGTSLWLNVHDDMADSLAVDPVLRQSTKVCAVYLNNPQSTYDVNDWDTNVYANYDGEGSSLTTSQLVTILSYQRYSNFYGGVDSVNQVYYDKRLIDYRADVDMLAMLSSDDGAIYIDNNSTTTTPQTDPLHHPAHCRAIINFANEAKVGEVKYNVSMYSLNNTNNESSDEFLVRHVLSGCQKDTIINIAEVSELSDLNVSVYPNPFNTNFVIEMNDNQDNTKVSVFNSLGQEVYSITFNSKTSIDTQQFESGIYLLKIDTGKSIYYKKMMKE
jgi:acetyl esterase/lipase